MQIREHEHGDVLELEVLDVDDPGEPGLGERLAAIEVRRYRGFVVNLLGHPAVDPRVVAATVHARQMLQRHGLPMVLVHQPLPLLDAFGRELLEQLDTCRTVAQALARLHCTDR